MNALTLEGKGNNQSVTQDNALIQAAYSLSLSEKRVLLLGMSKINPLEMPNRNSPFEFTITAKEYQQIYNVKKPYRDMLAAARGLKRAQVEIAPNHEISWTDECQYLEGEASIRIVFGWKASLYLAGMLDNFTSIPLLQVSRITRQSSIRIYMMLMQFKSTGFMVIGVDKLKSALKMENSYKRYTDFKKVVLNPAIIDINEKTDLSVSVKEIKEGRKVSRLEFSISAGERPKEIT